jgi:hypothetical protein
LWHGEPGTGKTFAIRALALAWKEWCRFEYVIDPVQLFESRLGRTATRRTCAYFTVIATKISRRIQQTSCLDSAQGFESSCNDVSMVQETLTWGKAAEPNRPQERLGNWLFDQI